MQNNNEPITFERFVNLVKTVCTVWLPKLSELSGTDVYFCGYTHSSWNILLAEQMDKVETIYKNTSRKREFEFASNKLIIDQDFLDWCGKYNHKFVVMGSFGNVPHIELHNIWKFPDNIRFNMRSGVFFLTKCNLSGAVDPVSFNISVQRIYLNECILSNKILKVIAATQVMDFCWCTNWDDVENIHTRKISIKFDMMSQLPKRFDFFRDNIVSCDIIAMTKQHKLSACIVSTKYLEEFFSNAKISELAMRCDVEDDFRPLSILFIQRLTKITVTLYSRNAALKASTHIVVDKINASKGSGNKTDLLLQCQEDLIEAGYSKYATV